MSLPRSISLGLLQFVACTAAGPGTADRPATSSPPAEVDGDAEPSQVGVDVRPACPNAVQLLWSDMYDYAPRPYAMVELLGVSVDHERAWVSHGVGGTTYDQPGAKLTIIEVDLVHGRALEHKQVAPTFDAAGMPQRVPALGRLWPTATDEADVAWLGRIAAEVGAWRGHGWFPVVASPDGRFLVHTRWPDRNDLDADWLALRDVDGRLLGRLEPSAMRTAYEPVFSADGKYVAYSGCRDYSGRGCLYDTYLEPVADHRRPDRKPRSAFSGRGPLQGKRVDVNGKRGDGHRFGPDGAHLFVLAKEERQACVFRVGIEDLGHERWLCVDADPKDRASMMTAGTQGLLAVIRPLASGGGAYRTELRWFSLATRDGAVARVVDELDLPGRMRDDGLAVGNHAVVTPEGQLARFPEALRWSEVSHFADDGTIVLLRNHIDPSGAGTLDLVRLDPDILLSADPHCAN